MARLSFYKLIYRKDDMSKFRELLYLALQVAGLLLAMAVGYGLLFIALIAAGCTY